MEEYEELGYESEESFLKDFLGCDDETWTLDDFFESYEPE